MAMAAHHMDIDWPSLEAMIVQAADAISAARPGARRDILESYVKRLEKLEGIADSFKGVSKSFALQAGREIRIMVESENDLRRGSGLAVEGHRAPHRERARVPGPDQGHRHPRDARRRLRPVVSRVSAVRPALGERALIDRIRERLPRLPRPLLVGIGDDAAVVEPERSALEVLTTDALVEGVHFDRRYSSLADIGYRALAVNLSDLAAMGATPRLALLSLMLPERITADDVDALARRRRDDGRARPRVGAGRRQHHADAGPLVVDVTVDRHRQAATSS